MSMYIPFDKHFSSLKAINCNNSFNLNSMFDTGQTTASLVLRLAKEIHMHIIYKEKKSSKSKGKSKISRAC